jgi:hypothetical protein
VLKTGAIRARNKGNKMDPKFFRKYLDIINERCVEDPATGELDCPGGASYPISEPDYAPGSEAWDIQRELQQRGLDDDSVTRDVRAADPWYKDQNFNMGSGKYSKFEYSRPKVPHTVDKYSPKGGGYNWGDVKYMVDQPPDTPQVTPQSTKSNTTLKQPVTRVKK